MNEEYYPHRLRELFLPYAGFFFPTLFYAAMTDIFHSLFPVYNMYRGHGINGGKNNTVDN